MIMFFIEVFIDECIWHGLVVAFGVAKLAAMLFGYGILVVKTYGAYVTFDLILFFFLISVIFFFFILIYINFFFFNLILFFIV